ncbi:hypothetical protein CROQUDRAFT_656146 [Cronartium quercuum f. sp. fusiforme G11]|uniref:Superoxide dismutase n=1 Tax=Cronartium quercuum f. sp. fusiforme G11 TaxID=708437 RepID=A0A9P6TE55_9BASI|nr:hypothetical protein CROQUDRAFT_656146 [Cronartium quercuum f. sp. fusiforme G11]
MLKTGITRSFRLGSPLALRDRVRPTLSFTFNRGKHTLPDLPYPYDALEPAISEQIMRLHHCMHHAAYVNGLNAAEEAYASALKANDALKQIELQAALKFNGGGHINHSLFWKNLLPEKLGGGKLKDGEFSKAVNQQYGSLDGLKSAVNAVALGIQGSGWAWLAFNQKEKKLVITSTGNQDPLTAPLTALLGIDMWEHAFYLQHQNRKADYLANIWKVMNFDEAEARYKSAST